MSTLPLPLAHVLEEEYIRLYGTDEEPLERRWRIREEEIGNARELARELAGRLGARTPPKIAQWREATMHDPVYRKAVAVELNEFLAALVPNRWLFEDDAFSDAERPPYDSLAEAKTFDPDGVFNVNREMFDRLFADWIRRGSDVRYAEVIRRIHARGKQGQLRSALSISGGGIRSATFALGVMQGLARTHILDQFDYVSTVSGGGYIGSWLSSWVRRDPWGIRGVASQLAGKPRDPLSPESEPVRHLRAFSNYLTPRLGILSADTWALIATYLRNLLLNWFVLIPLLAGVLAVPRVLFTAVVRDPRGSDQFASRGAVWGVLVGALLLLFGLARLVSNRPVTDSAEKKKFNDGSFVSTVLLPLLLSSLSFTLAWAWYASATGLTQEAPFPFPAWWFIVPSVAICVVAFIVFAVQFLTAPFVEKSMRGDGKTHAGQIGTELFGSLVAGALGGLLIWVAASVIFKVPVQEVMSVGAVRWPVLDSGGLNAVTAKYVVFAVPMLLGVLFLQAVVFVGAASHYNHDFDREWWARASGWILLGALVWIVLAAITIYGPVAIYHLPLLVSAIGGGAGLFSLLAGKSGKTDSSAKAKGEESTSSKLTNVALGAAVPIFVIFILALISTGTTAILRKTMDYPAIPSDEVDRQKRLAERASRDYPATVAAQPAKIRETPVPTAARLRSVEHLRIVQSADPLLMIAIALGCPLLALLFSRAIGVNVFSMHAMYRNRLVRAYLGASRAHREPNAFTGFDAKDNLLMHELRPEYLWAYSFRDGDRAVEALLAPTASPQLQFLAKQVREALGSDAKSISEDSATPQVRRGAVVYALNQLIATADLPHAYESSTTPAPPSMRALHNRRFIEQAFGDSEVYASPMPLYCSHDVIASEAAFVAALAPGASPAADALRSLFRHPHTTLGPILGELNDIITNAHLQGIAPFDHLPIDTRAYVQPAHRMIDNRLRIDAALPTLFTPLRVARPLHVVNICLNLTSGEELAWQERKGSSFTVTPLASGNHALGYRDTRDYGNISVGTAVTISGAAASPNMGYHSSPALAFLMTLFNVRLGWWLGNPGIAGNHTYPRRNPRSSILPFIHEATGNSNDKYPYVYLSDGGHFENLAMYEMVLRRCHRIVVSDAGADPRYIYDDLGNAVRKIRIDLGIPIDITHMGIMPPDQKEAGKYCAVGTIRYSAVDGPDAEDGLLLYIKPVVYDEGPRDVLNYKKNSTDFPHESTGDQFFSESQFESYRRLGYFAIEQISRQKDGLSRMTLDDLIAQAKVDLPQRAAQ